MKSSADFVQHASLALLLMGPPLSGKTNVLMQFPKPYVFDADMKLENAVRRLKTSKEFWYDRMLVDDKGKGVPEHLRWNHAVKCLDTAIDSPVIKTICIDSLTFLCDALISHILHTTKGEGGPNKKELKIGGERAMEQSYWNPFAMLLSRMITGLKASGKMIVCTVHEGTVEDEQGNVIKYVPTVPGKLKDRIAGMFTDVWHTAVKNVAVGNPPKMEQRYMIETRPTPRMQLGTSLGLPAEFELTWELLEKHMSGLEKIVPVPAPVETPVTPATPAPKTGVVTGAFIQA